jgi:hypothetical protein
MYTPEELDALLAVVIRAEASIKDELYRQAVHGEAPSGTLCDQAKECASVYDMWLRMYIASR